MKEPMKIAFVWQGLSGRYGQWKDGLWAAMKEIENQGHDVRYFDVDELDDLIPFRPDFVLYWEAPCTLQGKDAENYRAVMDLPFPKGLLFAGGPVNSQICYGFDIYFVESLINEEEFERIGLKWKRAFGVNTQIMRPEVQPTVFDGFMQATYALWKRHDLFARALKTRGIAAGRKQEHEPQCYESCEHNGVLTLTEQPAETVASLINASKFVVNTAEFWGGGQRCTLEAMACGKPVIVMSDSPKNREFVEESGAGFVVEPDAARIAEKIASTSPEIIVEMGRLAHEYVQRKWTERHYAEAILEGIRDILINKMHE